MRSDYVSIQPLLENRRYARVHGPFEAWRLGDVPAELEIVDLNIGGCFVREIPQPGAPLTYSLLIEVGEDGMIEVIAAVLYQRDDGSAVTFLNLSQQAFERIRRTVERGTR